LIELLVVVSVISLLMAALLPALGSARKRARSVVCQSNLREWGMTLNLYAQENEGRFPTDFQGTAGIWLLRGVFLDWSVRRVGLKELWTLKWSDDFDRANRWTKAGGVTPESWPEWMRGLRDY